MTTSSYPLRPSARSAVHGSAVRARPLTLALFAAGLLLAAGAALAGDRHHHGNRHVDYAKVVHVQPLIRYVESEVPVRECYETTAWREQTVHGHHVAGQPRGQVIGGTIVGGVIGGVIGDRFGGGEGRDAMRLLGTLVGAAIGHETASSRAAARTAPATYRVSEPYPVTECVTRHVRETREISDGYRVTYRYRGREYVTHMPHPPGREIPVDVDVRPVW